MVGAQRQPWVLNSKTQSNPERVTNFGRNPYTVTDYFVIGPRVVAALQPWARISERLRRLLTLLLARVDAHVEDRGAGGLRLDHDCKSFLFRSAFCETTHPATGWHLFRFAKTTFFGSGPTRVRDAVSGVEILYFPRRLICTKSDEGNFSLHHLAEQNAHRQRQLHVRFGCFGKWRHVRPKVSHHHTLIIRRESFGKVAGKGHS